MTQEREFRVKESVLIDILNYLSNRPYKETVDLINRIKPSQVVIDNIPEGVKEET